MWGLSQKIFLITRKKDNRNKHYASGLKTLKNLIGLKWFFRILIKISNFLIN
ncbi:hypothetical protein HPHPP13_1553 [Helicobacter pylori Hp P-13]|uniref:Uncharacterized protein n=1 Tax=Helicobacter pylori Hp P-13b TaxID=992107 RepID=A0ABC9QPX3_HELPX|nr:hypothetical protein HPHPP13_1553 [Helicobacter pylori Hp P-13]EJC30452.1 hypothetical protein HPHPP13B_1494 [Helicobacter pylori Hp P-13b]